VKIPLAILLVVTISLLACVPQKIHELPEGEATLQGSVLLDGKPLPNVMVQFEFSENRITPQVKTNAQGIYTFQIPVGEYHLKSIITDCAGLTTKTIFGPSKYDDNTSNVFMDIRNITLGKGVRAVKPIYVYTIISNIYPSDSTTIKNHKTVFLWHSYSNATKYKLMIRAEEELLYESQIIKDTSLLVTSNDLTTNVNKGREYLWYVAAFNDANDFIAFSHDYKVHFDIETIKH
jgi:hypothetical protein